MNDDPVGIEIPAQFFRELSEEASKDLFHRRNGWLNAAECRRLWKLLDRIDQPPETLQLMVKAEDVLRLWPPPQTH